VIHLALKLLSADQKYVIFPGSMVSAVASAAAAAAEAARSAPSRMSPMASETYPGDPTFIV
jgi:hypothetical protein